MADGCSYMTNAIGVSEAEVVIEEKQRNIRNTKKIFSMTTVLELFFTGTKVSELTLGNFWIFLCLVSSTALKIVMNLGAC